MMGHNHCRRSAYLLCVLLALAGSATACTGSGNRGPAPAPLRGSGASISSVGASGTLDQEINIEVPSFHGLEPSLGLVYDSAENNGVAGVGWRMRGLSSIQRSSSGRGAPRYGPGDVFFLEGVELLPCTPTMTSPSCRFRVSPDAQAYAAKMENFERIAYFPGPTGGQWKVWAKTGAVSTYQPRQSAPGAQAFAWDLASVSDTIGNRVDYRWWPDPAASQAGQSYLDSVVYGDVTVKLRYRTRPDPYTYANGAALVAVRDRLASVEVRAGKRTARVYQLDYATSTATGRSVLKQVQQFGDDAVVCTDATSTTCAYGRVKSGSALPPATFGAASMAAGNGTWQPKTIPLGTGASPVIGPPWPGQPYDSRPYQTSTPWLQYSGSVSWRPKSWVADVNGDGRDDVVVLRFLRDPAAPTDQEVLSTALATRNGFVLKDFEPDPTNRDPTLGVHEDFLMADADGDGMADVMQITNDDPATPGNEEHLQVWHSNGDGTYARTADHAVSWPYAPTVASCMSFNVSVGISLGIFSVGASWNIYSACNIDLDSRYFVADINGDGRADFVGASHASNNTVTLHSALSTGTGFTILPDVTTNWYWGDINTKRDRFFPADISGDGMADIVHIAYHPANLPGDQDSTPHAAVDVALSHGDGTYTFTGEHAGSAWDDEDVWYPGDINGDRKTDLIHIFRQAPDATTSYDHGGFRVGLSDGTGTKFRWVSGGTTFPWYRPAPFANANKYPSPWMVGDINGDGRGDIASVSDVDSAGTPTQNLAVVFAGADNTFTTDPAYRSGIQPAAWPWQPPDEVPAHLADLNGDGKSDLVFTPWRGPGFDYPLDLIGYLSPNRGLDTAGWYPADINGDGRSDFVYVYFRNPGYTVYTLIAQPDGSYKRAEDTVDFVNMPGATADLNTPDTAGWMVADVGGGPGKAADGRADLVYVDHVANKRLTVYSLISDGTGHYRHQAKAFLLSYNSEFPAEWQPWNWITADLNGDGRTDLVEVYHELGEARVHTLLSEGDGDWTWSRSAFFTGLAAGDGTHWQTGDINGDGRADLVMAAAANGITTVRSLLANGNGTWRPVTKVAVDSAGASPGFPDTRRWMVMEANGDGMADLGYIEHTGAGARVHTLTSIGDGTFVWDKSPVLTAPQAIDMSDVTGFKRADTKADGLTDLVHVSSRLDTTSGALETAVVLITNRQPGWVIEGQPDVGYAFPDTQNWRVTDRDGDGHADLAYLKTGLQTLRLPVTSDMVNHVTSPMGAQSQISYSPSSTWDANQANSRCHLPLGVVREEVQSVTTSDGRPGSPSTVTYGYSCAAWSDTERGFLGWKEVYEYRPGAANQPAGTTLVRYDLGDACLARPEYRQTYDDSGAVFDKSTIDYLPPGTTAPYRCLINSTNNITVNQWVAAPNDHTYYTYDDFGNVTSMSEQADPGTTGDERFTSRTFHPETSSYIVGLPAGEQVREGRDSSGPVLRTRMYCYDGDTSLTCTQPPSRGLLTTRRELNLNGLADLAVTNYAYNAVGNLAGMQDPDSNMSWLFYDAAHIYPVLSCNAAQQCQTLAWDQVTGRVTAMKDANGRITSLDYDQFRQVHDGVIAGRRPVCPRLPRLGQADRPAGPRDARRRQRRRAMARGVPGRPRQNVPGNAEGRPGRRDIRPGHLLRRADRAAIPAIGLAAKLTKPGVREIPVRRHRKATDPDASRRRRGALAIWCQRGHHLGEDHRRTRAGTTYLRRRPGTGGAHQRMGGREAR